MIWITIIVFVMQGFPPINDRLEFPDQQSCEAKRIEIATSTPAAQTTICTMKPPAVVVHAQRRAKR